MADVTLMDIAEGVRDTWAACGSAVTDVIPASKVYFKRQPEGAAYPFCCFTFKDVSAYFGGTEYFSGTKYVKATQITLKVHHLASVDMRTFTTALNNALGWGESSPAASWTIPNATVLSAMPEVEDTDLEEERVDGEDIAVYETTFTVKMQAER